MKELGIEGGRLAWGTGIRWTGLMVPLLLAMRLLGHDWHRHEETPVPAAAAKIRLRTLPKATNGPGVAAAGSTAIPVSAEASARADLMARTFVRFQPALRFWWNADEFRIGSDGMPAHGMMEGITA